MCLFLTAPLSYAAVVFHLGQREQLLRYGKLATSSWSFPSRVFHNKVIGDRGMSLFSIFICMPLYSRGEFCLYSRGPLYSRGLLL